MSDHLSELIARKATLLQQIEDVQSEFKQVYTNHQRLIDQAQAKLNQEHKQLAEKLNELRALVRSGDWTEQLRLIGSSPEMTRPKFRLNQRVFSDYTAEDTGITSRDFGVVKGLMFNHPDCSPGWWYWVRWDELNSAPWLKVPHYESCHESELFAAPSPSLTNHFVWCGT